MTAPFEGHRHVASEVEKLLPQVLPAFLPQQRWFGGKARTVVGVDVEDMVHLCGEEAPYMVAIVGVSYADAPPTRYGLLLGVFDEPRGLPTIGRLLASHSPGWVVEAATDADGAGDLIAGFLTEREVLTARGGRLRYGDVTPAARAGLAGVTAVTPVGTEQSNTSLRVGRGLVFKLFRRIEPGENPELEVGRFLTRHTAFRAMAALQGSLTYVSPDGEPSTLGVLQDWVENSGDGWRHVVSHLRECLERGAVPERLAQDMDDLGRITADFHGALASARGLAAFDPEPVDGAAIDTWNTQFLEQAARSVALVRSGLAGWPADTRQLALSLLAATTDLAAVVPALGQVAEGVFQQIRIHGDYHLGQTLKTEQGFAIIDFEGEPTRPLAERRQKHCALKDVAGMLRSFDYAIETACASVPEAADRLRGSVPLREWFLAGYMARAIGAAYLPSDPQALKSWLAFFELEKAFYELEYEINNRPAWVRIPLRGISHVLQETL